MGHKEHIVGNACDKFPYKLNCIDHQCWGVLRYTELKWSIVPVNLNFQRGKHFFDVYARIWKLFYMPWKHCFEVQKGSPQYCLFPVNQMKTSKKQTLWVTNTLHQLTSDITYTLRRENSSVVFSSSHCLWEEYYHIQEEARNQKTNKLNLINSWN